MIRSAIRAALIGCLLLSLPIQTPASTQEVPSPAQVLGYELGERFTTVAGISHYFSPLAEASDRVSVHPYGTTVEGRPLLQVLVASPAKRARLDEILELNREPTLPETPAGRAAEIVRSNPAVVYLSYGVHGNESSSSEAAMWTAYDLARGAEDVGWVLDSVPVIIDPMVNSGGRSNHHPFDLNRDWAWMTQPETRARLATWDQWIPQIHADLHEMGSNSSYSFFPAASAPQAGGAYGYLLPPGFDEAPSLVRFLEEGGRAYAQPNTFRLGGVPYPQGTLFLPRGRNEGLVERIRTAGLGPCVLPVETGLTETGLDLGTGSAEAGPGSRRAGQGRPPAGSGGPNGGMLWQSPPSGG